MPQDLPELDETIVDLPNDLRENLANRGKTDLYFLAKSILGYKDLTPKCHGPLGVFMDQNPARFKLTLIPRGHFKTSFCTITRIMQKVVSNPNGRYLIANETSTNAERFLSAIRQHAEGNRVFRALYSDIIPKDMRRTRWSSKELQFNREWMGPEPTIDTVGMTGAWTSRHFTHITFDDPISEEAAKSELVMRDVIGRISKVFSLMVNVEEDTFDLTGTRWAFFDVYSYMVKWLGPRVAKFIRGAIEDGEPIFPERFSLETLAAIRDAPDMGEYMFSCQYMNNPRNAELQDFNIGDLRFWRWSSTHEDVVLYDPSGEIRSILSVEDLDITVTVDLAPAERVTSDRNAIVTTGVSPGGDVIVLDAWAKRCPPSDVIAYLFKLKARYHPRVFGIESVAYQKAFKYFIRDEAARRNEYLNVVDIKAVGKKEIRIRGLQPVAATGHMYILPTQHILRNEMSDFPLGEHDDVLDALSMHLQLWRGLLSSDSIERNRQREREALAEIRHGRARREGLNIQEEEYDSWDEQPEIQEHVMRGIS